MAVFNIIDNFFDISAGGLGPVRDDFGLFIEGRALPRIHAFLTH